MTQLDIFVFYVVGSIIVAGLSIATLFVASDIDFDKSFKIRRTSLLMLYSSPVWPATLLFYIVKFIYSQHKNAFRPGV